MKAFQSSSFSKVDASGEHAGPALRPSLSGSATYMRAEHEKEKENKGSRWGRSAKK